MGLNKIKDSAREVKNSIALNAFNCGTYLLIKNSSHSDAKVPSVLINKNVRK